MSNYSDFDFTELLMRIPAMTIAEHSEETKLMIQQAM